jgi:16S rRNA (guanine966-N2)-methyltransferase
MKNKQHTQQVRIIGGTHRRRIVKFDEAEGLRPTPDRVREQVFNWLGQRLNGLKVLDLFGGSGVMAFESASRGASQVDVVELNRQTVQNMRAVIKELQLECVNVHQQDAKVYLQAASVVYDVIVLDPPYRWQDWDVLWGLLQTRCHNDTVLYIEAAQLPQLPEWLQWSKQDKAGQSHYGLALVQDIDL